MNKFYNKTLIIPNKNVNSKPKFPIFGGGNLEFAIDIKKRMLYNLVQKEKCMKRLAIYFTVLVSCLFVGLTTYYLIKNYEFIDIKAETELETIYLNKGEQTTLEIVHERKKTQLKFEIEDTEVISFNVETGVITAKDAGTSKLTITPENQEFGPYEFDINVGDGTSDCPYYIKNESDLKAIGGTRVYSETSSVEWSANAHYCQVADINLTDDWQPLCPSELFTGSFEGNGQVKITGLSITGTKKYAGLFTALGELARIESLIIVDPVINGQFDFAGVVAAMSVASTVTKVEVTGAKISVAPYTVQTTTGNVQAMYGGIVGATRGAKIDKAETYSERGEISMCSFQGKIEILGQHVMQFVEDGKNEIISVGGLAGYTYASTIHNSKAEVDFVVPSDVSAKAKQYQRAISTSGLCIDIGGITGLVSIDTALSKNDEGQNVVIQPLIKNNLAIVSLTNETTSSYGVIGHLPIDVQLLVEKQCIIGNHYYSKDGKITEGGSPNNYWSDATMIIASEAKLKDMATFTTTEWEISENGSTPWLISSGEAPKINFIKGGVNSDNYTNSLVGKDETYEIKTEEDFVKYYNHITSGTVVERKYYLKQRYVLSADINIENLTGITVFVPIGGDNLAFTGSFDGNGHTITFGENLRVNTQNSTYGGLFGQIAEGAEVKNLKVSGIKISEAKYAGAVAGVNYGTISNVTVEDITIQGVKYAGAIVGFNGGNIQDCNVDCSDYNEITTNNVKTNVYIGSIAGFNDATISSVTVNGSFLISAQKTTNNEVKRFFGGLVGYNSGSLKNCCVAAAEISDYSTIQVFFGGLAGVNSGEIEFCGAGQAGTTVEIKAAMESGSQVAGGFAGLISEDATVTTSFANVNISCSTTAGFAPYLFGEVTLSYNMGNLQGDFVGGFAVYMVRNGQTSKGGHVCDCYTKITIASKSENSVLSGLCVYTRHPAVIEKCIMGATFELTAGGEAYYESATNTREGYVNFINSLLKKDSQLGTITNVIIDVKEKDELTGDSFVEKFKNMFISSDDNVVRTKTLVSYNDQKVTYLQSANITKDVLEKFNFIVEEIDAADDEAHIGDVSDTKSFWAIVKGEEDVDYIIAKIEGLYDVHQSELTKKKVEVPVATDFVDAEGNMLSKLEFVYDGNQKTIKASEDVTDWEITGGNVEQEPGVYKIRVKLINPETTRWADGSSGSKSMEITWEIKHLESTVNPVYNAEQVAKDIKLSEITISLSEGDTAGTIAWKNQEQALVEGTNNCQWVFTPTDAHFQTVEGTVQITVQAAAEVPTEGAEGSTPAEGTGSSEEAQTPAA